MGRKGPLSVHFKKVNFQDSVEYVEHIFFYWKVAVGQINLGILDGCPLFLFFGQISRALCVSVPRSLQEEWYSSCWVFLSLYLIFVDSWSSNTFIHLIMQSKRADLGSPTTLASFVPQSCALWSERRNSSCTVCSFDNTNWTHETGIDPLRSF